MEFYSKIGMTNTGWTKGMNAGSLKLTTLVRIAEVLECDVHELLYGEPESTKPYKQKPDPERNAEDRAGGNWEAKYYALLEKYNRCLEEKDSLRSFRGNVVTGPELKKPE